MCKNDFFCPYLKALTWQRRAAEERIADKRKDCLLLVEHEPVITLGSSSDRSHLLIPEEEFEKKGIKLVETDRGGDVTYHGPGQLVIYPIFKLLPPYRDVKRYVRLLEEAAIRIFANWGLEAFRVKGKTGVWTPAGKIAQIGVRIKRWVTYHGISLNIAPNMEAFSLIVPCGLHGDKVTSMKDLLGKRSFPSLEAVATHAVQVFRELFQNEFETIRGSEIRDGS